MILRPALPRDADALAAFARDSFDAAFGRLYEPQDLAAFFAAERSAERYRTHLADPSTRIQLAEEGGTLSAYSLIVLGRGFDERPEPRPARPVYLSQLYCGPSATGKGLGAALLAWAISEASGWGADAVQLSVFSENQGAQRFYHRHGFEHVADIDFWVGTQRDHEFLYELTL